MVNCEIEQLKLAKLYLNFTAVRVSLLANTSGV